MCRFIYNIYIYKNFKSKNINPTRAQKNRVRIVLNNKKTVCGAALHGGFRLEAQHKLVRLGVDVLLRQLDVGDPPARHHQAEVHALEQEDGTVLQAAGERVLADQRPLAGQPVVPAVLQGGTRSQVALQEGLVGRRGGLAH